MKKPKAIPGTAGVNLFVFESMIKEPAPTSIIGVQTEMAIWQSYNFPDAPPEIPLLGVVEEMGEFHQAKDTEETMDAIGDAGIFLLDYCNRYDIRADVVIDGADTIPAFDGPIRAIGALAHAHIKGHQKIRHKPAEIAAMRRDAVARVLRLLIKHASLSDLVFSDCLVNTWSQVRTRDWKKFPTDGRTK